DRPIVRRPPTQASCKESGGRDGDGERRNRRVDRKNTRGVHGDAGAGAHTLADQTALAPRPTALRRRARRITRIGFSAPPQGRHVLPRRQPLTHQAGIPSQLVNRDRYARPWWLAREVVMIARYLGTAGVIVGLAVSSFACSKSNTSP